MPRRVRVVVTTYERLPWLRLALRAWARQTYRDFALTVADDGSGPDTRAFVEAYAAAAPFPVHHAWWKNEGFRRAGILNEAVRRSEGEPLLLFTDGDCVPPATFLEGHVAVHGPRSFAVGGAWKLTKEESATVDAAAVDAGAHERLRSKEEARDLGRKRWKSVLGTRLRFPHRPKIVGLNVGIDRALFEEVNGYDEAFVGYGLEDSDLRDRVMATKPRPRPAILYGRVDTVHLWHAPADTAGRRLNRAYWESKRPVRCVHGLVDERATRGAEAVPAAR